MRKIFPGTFNRKQCSDGELGEKTREKQTEKTGMAYCFFEKIPDTRN